LKQTLIGTLGFAVLFTLAGCGTQSAMKNIPANAPKVTVNASNFKWTLSQTTFKVGQPIHFVVSSTEGAHGFHIVNTNVDQIVSQGNPALDVGWIPKTAGTYTLACDDFCGAGHSTMFTTLTVTN